MKFSTIPGNSLLLQVEGTETEIGHVVSALTFIDKKDQRAYDRATKEGYSVDPPTPKILFDLQGSRIYVGHAQFVIDNVKAYGVQVEYTPEPTPPWEGEVASLYGLDFRDYQIDAIKAAMTHKVGIIKGSTGMGKTAVVGGIIATAQQPSLTLVTQVPLLLQASADFNKWGIPDLGVVGNKTINPGFHTIADARYLGRLIKARNKTIMAWLKTVRVLIIDEAQLSTAASWERCILSLQHVEMRISLSGTPYQSRVWGESVRDLELQGVFRSIIYEIKAAELAERGFIATPQIYMLPVSEHPIRTKVFQGHWRRGQEWRRVLREGIIHHEHRNQLARQVLFLLSQVHKLQTLVLVQEIQHGIDTIEGLRQMGVKAVFVAGDKKVYFQGKGEEFEIDEIIDFKSATVRRFAEKEFDVLVASPVFSVGYDLPGDMVEAMMLLGGGKSLIPVLQRLGRALRPKSGDNTVVVIDFDDQQHYNLRQHSTRRWNEYKAEGWTVQKWEAFQKRFLTQPS